ncbi:unnamed protein product [Linum trigynum]|uniref:Uncharacterized protein n=1 Tax=Linum trigynum TaxID=586398 RepID=A0AAV2G1B1_9ROSI
MLWNPNRDYSAVCFVVNPNWSYDEQWRMMPIMIEVEQCLKTSFTFVSFVFALSSTNRAAHRVVQTALASVATLLVDYRFFIFTAL